MSSQQSGIVSTVVDSLRLSGREQFHCEFCGLSYDDERPNCPACGGPVVSQQG